MKGWTTTIETWGRRSCWYEEHPVVWEGQITGVSKTICIPGGQKARVTVEAPVGRKQVYEYDATGVLQHNVPVMGDSARTFILHSREPAPC